jgi:hypothetical protein
VHRDDERAQIGWRQILDLIDEQGDGSAGLLGGPRYDEEPRNI